MKPLKVAKWSFIICLVLGSIVISLIRIQADARVRRRYRQRLKSGQPFFKRYSLSQEGTNLLLEHLQRCAGHSYADLVKDTWWSSCLQWYSEKAGEEVYRHLYLADSLPISFTNWNSVDLLTQVYEWVKKDYFILLEPTQVTLGNCVGLYEEKQNLSSLIEHYMHIPRPVLLVKVSPLPRLFHRQQQ